MSPGRAGRMRIERPMFVAVTIGLLLIASGYATARWLAWDRGLRGTYLTAEGEIVHSRIDREVSFDRGVRLRSVYTNHWDPKRLGVPREFPSARIVWTGFLTVPEPAPGSAPAEEATRPGLLRRIYAGERFGGSPLEERVVDDLAFDARQPKDRPVGGSYAIEWYGQLRVPEAGTYLFATRSDDDSWLFVDEALVVENRYRLAPRRRRGEVELAPGLHSLRVRYVDRRGRGVLGVSWKRPGATERSAIPGALLSHAVGETTSYGLAIDSRESFRVEAGGEEILAGSGGDSPHHFSPPLAPGRHPVTFELFLPEWRRDLRFRPGWIGPDGAFRDLPASALSLSGRRPRLGLVLDAAFASALAGLGLSLLVSRGWRSRAGCYAQWLWRHRGTAAVAAVLLLSFLLRVHQYDVVPSFLETRDEFKTGWIGWTLLHECMPAGWSLYPGPNGTQETWFGETFTIDRPKLHPPPLFPILTGIASTLAGVDRMLGVSLSVIRIPAIVCSALATLLVVLLAQRFYDRPTAVVAGLLHATIPTVVASARLAKEESLLVALALASLLLVKSYEDTGRRSRLYLSILLAGLATLTKETGLYVGAVVFLLLARHGRWPEVLTTLPVYLGVYLLYFAYCWVFSGDPLAVAGGIQTAAPDGFGTVAKLLGTGRVAHAEFGAGWMVWLALATMATSVRSNWTIVGPVLAYLLVLAVTLGEVGDYGWHRIPLYPFLCIGGGVFLVEMVRKADLFRAGVFAVLALMTSLHYLAAEEMFVSASSLKWILFAAMLPFAAHFAFPDSKAGPIAQGAAVLLVAGFALANVLVVLHLVSIYP